MLPDLLEVRKARLLPLEDGAHPTEGRALEALAPVQRVAVLDHPDHVPGDRVDELLGRVDLPQSELVVISVVERVAQVGVEGVYVREAGEVVEHGREPLGDRLLGKLDLAHVEGPDAGDLVARMDDRGGAALGPGQDNVDEVVRRRDRGHLLEVVGRHGHTGGSWKESAECVGLRLCRGLVCPLEWSLQAQPDLSDVLLSSLKLETVLTFHS